MLHFYEIKNMSSTLFEFVRPAFEKIIFKVIKNCNIPRHVAIVADGARRFGQRHKIPVQENHEIGIGLAIMEVVDWCLELGVREYTLLLLSLGNYYRPEEEVSHWKILFKDWILNLIKNWKILQKKGIRFHFVGKLSLLPEDARGILMLLVLLTKKNNNVQVTFLIGYTAKYELSKTALDIMNGIRGNKIEKSSISEELINNCLFTFASSDPDLVIRTSGFKRVSALLTWQTTKACVYFCDCLWPDFNRNYFIKAIFYYQQHVNSVRKVESWQRRLTSSEKVDSFSCSLQDGRNKMLMESLICQFKIPVKVNLRELYFYDDKELFDYFNRRHPVPSCC